MIVLNELVVLEYGDVIVEFDCFVDVVVYYDYGFV